MNKVIDFLDHLECPLVNGILYPDESIQLMDVKVDWGRLANTTIRAGSKTSIEELSKIEELEWTYCGIMVQIVDQIHAIEVIGGEAASYGSDGFVAVLNQDSKKLLWLAFFDCSNPFYKLEVVDDVVIAVSTVNCAWKFNIKNPANCTVACQ